MSEEGRSCPADYQYDPSVLARPVELTADTLYIIGGLYGNRPALRTVCTMAAQEQDQIRIVFNGDFNWFNVDPVSFEEVNQVVLRHMALRGNVETELAAEQYKAGCGCGYPDWVGDDEVARSNAMLRRLRDTVRAFPDLRVRLSRLPMHLVAQVGDVRLAIVHGDATALNGWGFSWERLRDASYLPWVHTCFRQAAVRIFASSHTCLPVLREYESEGLRCVIVNNGAAGMPNFAGSKYGVGTRISIRPHSDPLYYRVIDNIFIEAIRIPYDCVAWDEEFLTHWPVGSPGHESYFRRMVEGPDFRLEQASPDHCV